MKVAGFSPPVLTVTYLRGWYDKSEGQNSQRANSDCSCESRDAIATVNEAGVFELPRFSSDGKLLYTRVPVPSIRFGPFSQVGYSCLHLWSACVGRLLSELKLDLIAAIGVKSHARLSSNSFTPTWLQMRIAGSEKGQRKCRKASILTSFARVPSRSSHGHSQIGLRRRSTK